MSSKTSLVRAGMVDQPRLIKFLFDNYIPSEPLHVGIGPGDEDMDYILRGVPRGHTLLAVDGDNLLGVAINGDITSDEHNVRAKQLAEATCDKEVAFLRFWTHAERAAGFWVEGEPTRGLVLEVLCVSVEARGRGIGQALVEASRQLARQDGYPLFRMDCTSYYAARLAEVAGMTRVFSLPYDDYKDENGEPIFNIKPPHKGLNIFKHIF